MPVGLDRDDLDMVLDAIGQYARSHLPDAKLRELDAADEFPEGIVREMCGEGLGVSLLFISEEFGGMGGSAMDIYRVCEQLAAIDVGIATGVLATFLGSDPIMFGGTPEQQKRWMTRIANEGLLMAYGATEPEAGSDLAAMRTTAEPIVETERETLWGGSIKLRNGWTLMLPEMPPDMKLPITVNARKRGEEE